jgi:alpha-glucosidase
VVEIVTAMRSVMDEYAERVMIGEMYLSIHQTMAYYGPNNSGAHLPGNFTLLLLPWDARKIAVAIDECESSLPPGAWPNWVLGNHDRSRLATRAGKEQARVAAILLLTLRGTPTMYYGDEIGIPDVDIPKEEMQDPQGKKTGTSRDSYRTPMQWTPRKNAGFTENDVPWLPVHAEYETQNVEAQMKDPLSLLSLYRKLLALRRNEPAFQIGDYLPIPAEGNLLLYKRVLDRKSFLIALNFGDSTVRYSNDRFQFKGTIVLDSTLQPEVKGTINGSLVLKPHQGLIIELEPIARPA